MTDNKCIRIYDKYHNCYEYSNNCLNINCTKRIISREIIDILCKKYNIDIINIYLENLSLFNNFCNLIKKIKSKPITIYIEKNDEAVSDNIINNIEDLNDNVKIKYKRIINFSKEKRQIEIDNVNSFDIDTLLLNLPNNRFFKTISKFDKESIKYVELEKELVKRVYSLLKIKYPNIDELDNDMKRNIVYNYMNDIQTEDTDEMSSDPLVTFIRKKGNTLGKSRLFEILLNNKYLRVSDTNYLDYSENQKYNTLKNINIITI